MKSLSLYIHFPYCLYKCHYCDFNSYAVKSVASLQDPYIAALIQEFELAQEKFSLSKLKSIFLGGGTPSLFEPDRIKKLLKYLEQHLGFSSEIEITLEVNPKTLDREKLKAFVSAGINRFSVGIQSFQDKFLSPLGRLHDSQEAKDVLRLFDSEQVPNYNFDLMFAFPGQSLEELKEDLKQASNFHPKHISFYNLTLEEGTIFAEHVKQGKIRLLDSDLQAEMYEEGVAILESQGYPLYEISNFAEKGYESRHNLAYWKYEDYLGLGAGAFSFMSRDLLRIPCQGEGTDLYGVRWMNPKSPELYLKNPSQAYSFGDWEKIDLATAKKEYWMMGLRLREGIDTVIFEEKFGKGSLEIYSENLKKIINKSYLKNENQRLCLTPQGRLLANEVISSFFME